MTRSATPMSEYTPQQEAAITARNVSVSLSAGAGCGKTFVLTERYLSHLDPGVPGAISPEQIGQLVAITFTDRAAREMRDRIRRKCYERLQSCDAADVEYWGALLRTLDNARISTIHGFCGALLRARAVEAGLDPQFTVLEQAQADALLSEAVDDVLRDRIAAEDEAALSLAVRFNLDGVRGMVRSLVLDSTPELLAKWRDIPPDELLNEWQNAFETLLPRIVAQVVESEPAQTILAVLNEHVPQNAKMAARRDALLQTLGGPFLNLGGASSVANQFREILEHARVQGGGGVNAWPDADAYEVFRNASAELRDLVKPLIALMEFNPADAREAAMLGTTLLQLADHVFAAYWKRKQELRVLDFNDLLVRARSLLVGDGGTLARELSAGITLLLVDEFQDTDPLQVELVKALCGDRLANGRLFFVGDFKQSIYRFRGAKPYVFRDLRREMPVDGRLSLSKNFRSQPAILNFVNALFAAELGADYEPLEADRPQVSSQPAIEFLWAPAADGKESVEEMRAREADWIARRLREIIDSGEPIIRVAQGAQHVARAVKPGDVAILLRALTSVELYEAALRRYELDYYLVGGHAFYAQQEVFDLLNLLRTVNDAEDVVSLAGALRSPFFGLADETLFWLGQNSGGLGRGLLEGTLPTAIDEQQRRQVRYAADVLAELRACKDRVRVSELIERALDRTGYDATLLCEFLGERKLANLQKLEEQARSFQRGDFLELSDFITRLADFVSRKPDEALAATHSEDTDVVRLMTVHQSKGLEFPLVVVPDLNRSPYSGSNRAHLHEQLGPLVRSTSGEDDERAPSGYDLWRFTERSEEAAESKRLLYVATTRAADYLILSGSVKNIGDAKSPWMKVLARQFDLETGRFLGSKPPKGKEPQVRVTATAPPKFQPRGHARRGDVAKLAKYLDVPPGPPERLPPVHSIEQDATANRQFSFSRLSGKLHRRFERLDDGSLQIEGRDPRQLGTLVHAVLGVVDFARAGELGAFVDRLAEQHVPDAPAEAAEARQLLEQFAETQRALALVAAVESHAELEFLLPWAADNGKSTMVLRGYLDRLYRDTENGWHILDFKTNQLGTRGAEAVAAEYELQMYVYALAAERILGVPPVELTLHFLRTGEEVSFGWGDNARKRVVRMIDDAIRSALAEPPQG